MPKQFQTFAPPQKYIAVFRNSDYLGGSYNAEEVILEERNRSFSGPGLEQTDCAKAATEKFNALIAIYDKQIQAANDARSAAILDLGIRLLLELSGADLWLAIEEIIKELWQSTNGYVLAAGVYGGWGIPPGGWDNPDLPDGWYQTPYAPDDELMPGSIDEPGIGDGPDGPKPTPTQPGKPPKPPKPPRDPSKLGQWLKDNWRKIIGKIPVKSLWDLILKALKKVAPWIVAAIVAAYAYEFKLLDDIFNRELARINAEKAKAREWLDKTLRCCRDAAECGSDGKGCDTPFIPYPDGTEPQPNPRCPQMG